MHYMCEISLVTYDDYYLFEYMVKVVPPEQTAAAFQLPNP